LRNGTAEEPGAGPELEPACSQTSTGAMNLPWACVGGGGGGGPAIWSRGCRWSRAHRVTAPVNLKAS
jgi:hypothetical protein